MHALGHGRSLHSAQCRGRARPQGGGGYLSSASGSNVVTSTSTGRCTGSAIAAQAPLGSRERTRMDGGIACDVDGPRGAARLEGG